MASDSEDDKIDGGATGLAVADKKDSKEASEEEVKETLQLEVETTSPSACERHVTVIISRADIDRYFDNAYGEIMPTATVPGFRAGRAPRKVVESRYREEVTEQIKGSLLMDSLEQVSEEQKFTAISEPNFDLDAVELPKEGPMTYEFTIEVRPEFDMPKWKGLSLNRPIREFTDADIDQQLEQMISRYGQLAPHRGPAEEGDYLTVNITCTAGGEQVAQQNEEVVRIRPSLSFTDGHLEDFDTLMAGVEAGDKRSGEVELTQNASNVELRGEKVRVEFEVLEVKKLKLPDLTPDLLQEIGDFSSEEDLRAAIQKDLQRQLEYQQQQNARRQITMLLTKSADWDLPQGLLERQSARELERAVMELRRSGFSEAEIRVRENLLKQNSEASTATALKEHFILERIAEEESVDVEEGDYDQEISLMAMQSGESPRRVRAQLEKRGMMDVLRNQIVERKVLECVQAEAKFKDEKYEPPRVKAEAIDMAAGGGSGTAIPEITEKKEEEKENSSD